MPYVSHLTEADIRRSVAGTASEQTERHVRLCIFCAHRLAEVAQRETHWERRGPLRRLVRIDPSRDVDELMIEIEDELRRNAA